MYTKRLTDYFVFKRYNHFFKEFIRLQKQLRLVRSSKGNILEDTANISSSDINISKMEHSNLIQGLFYNSTVSLNFNLGKNDFSQIWLNSYNNENFMNNSGIILYNPFEMIIESNH